MSRIALLIALLFGVAGCSGATITACDENDPVASCHKAHGLPHG